MLEICANDFRNFQRLFFYVASDEILRKNPVEKALHSLKTSYNI